MLTQIEWFHRIQALSSKEKAEPALPTVAQIPRPTTQVSFPQTETGLAWSVVSTREEMVALERDWRQLETNTLSPSNVFLTYEWNYHWVCSFLPTSPQNSNSLKILVARRAGKVVSLWPLQCKTFMGSHHLHWMGDPVSQYGDILVKQGEDVNAILWQGWQYICQAMPASLLVLRKVREDATIMKLIHKLEGTLTCDDSAMSLALDEAPSFEDYMRRFSKKESKNRRRLRNRLAKQGELRFEMLTAPHKDNKDTELAVRYVQTAIKLKRAWLNQNIMVSKAFANPALDVFFTRLFKENASSLGGQIAVLHCGDKIAAMMAGFLYQGHFHAHISVVNPEFSADRPGIALMEDLLAWHYQNGTRVFDLLAPADSYKKIWTSTQHPIGDYTLSVNASGTVYTHIMLRGFRQTGKRLTARLPEGLKSRIYKTAQKLLWKQT